jgi:hypothetical protein
MLLESVSVKTAVFRILEWMLCCYVDYEKDVGFLT